MPRRFPLSEDSRRFFKHWREEYRWPIGLSRQESEQRIEELMKITTQALAIRNRQHIREVLIKIHKWKTLNQRKVTDFYAEILGENEYIIDYILTHSPMGKLAPDNVDDLLSKLKIGYCNLPICSAQVSFLTNRTLPILDRFVAQFFSRTMSSEILNVPDVGEVLKDIDQINFQIEDDGTHRAKPRLAVYQLAGYEFNKLKFVRKLITELEEIAEALNTEKVFFDNVQGKTQKFSCVDVEMAVFAFATQNRNCFECFYGKNQQPTRLNK